MKIPKTVKVGGMIYRIIDGYKFDERTDVRGLADHNQLIIRLGNMIDNNHTRELVFIHEVLHAINNVYNAEGLEEDEIDRMAHGLYQVLTDNDMVK